MFRWYFHFEKHTSWIQDKSPIIDFPIAAREKCWNNVSIQEWCFLLFQRFPLCYWQNRISKRRFSNSCLRKVWKSIQFWRFFVFEIFPLCKHTPWIVTRQDSRIPSPIHGLRAPLIWSQRGITFSRKRLQLHSMYRRRTPLCKPFYPRRTCQLKLNNYALKFNQSEFCFSFSPSLGNAFRSWNSS